MQPQLAPTPIDRFVSVDKHILDHEIELIHISDPGDIETLQAGDIIGISKYDDRDPRTLMLMRQGGKYVLKRRREMEPVLRRALLTVVGASVPHAIEVIGFVVLWIKRR